MSLHHPAPTPAPWPLLPLIGALQLQDWGWVPGGEDDLVPQTSI